MSWIGRLCLICLDKRQQTVVLHAKGHTMPMLSGVFLFCLGIDAMIPKMFRDDQEQPHYDIFFLDVTEELRCRHQQKMIGYLCAR
jgi:hypothetical protein